MPNTDRGYKLLFSNPDIVRSLLRDVVRALNGHWVDGLDLSTLAPVKTEFVTPKLQLRSSDSIWRVRRHDGSTQYLQLILEFQSQADWDMGLRLLTYRCLLYEGLRMSGELAGGERFPAVVPIVVYTGLPPWTAALDIADLIEPVPQALQPYQARQRYLLIDVRRQAHNEALAQDSLARLLFRLEHNQGPDDVAQLTQRLASILQGDEYLDVQRAILTWVRRVLLPRSMPGKKLRRVKTLTEVKMIVQEDPRSWFYQERQKGEQQGQATLLSRQLQHKFGTLTPAVQQRLAQASTQQLEVWSLNLLNAATLEQVFAQPQ
ncbi:Rpn family recombination-promoting nuclease/putative transposase [Pusillimonas sp. CC-YST705]|uniref:Rpn family recombination-promoting nuclease/putative transposase n=1 Tax=Mesopusillimonas faecipullorum TaxID=2755040 RepID=A0ABS8C9L2_9BURK|nr:Rpn family recombination-promoting nuclease/putative transposase [Mesopusillimonas faecipullorum]MCB5362722.1 Rpn family recombination-promoting nuclease/putative transposase [Mesopusillimonas faecipullorum]